MPESKPSATSLPSCDTVRRRIVTALALVSGLLVAPAQAQRTVLEVIEPRYRTADELMAILRPFLAADGAMSSAGNRIVLRTTPANLDELRKILDTIDRRPRDLMITVTEDVDLVLRENEVAVGGRVGDGAGQVEVPLPPGRGPSMRAGEAGARVFSSQSSSRASTGRSVRVLEGATAFVATGQSVPLSSTAVIRTPDGRRIVQQTQSRQAVAGFHARARVNGDRVTVELSNRNDRVVRRDSGVVETRQMDTVVSGRLGEWIELGGAAQSRASDESAITYRSDDAARDLRRLFLKVDVIDGGARDAR